MQGHRDYVIKTLLHGMTGPLAGQTYTQVMLPMGAQTDQWVANVSSYVRNSFGNSAPFITAAEVARVRAAIDRLNTDGSLPPGVKVEPFYDRGDLVERSTQTVERLT